MKILMTGNYTYRIPSGNSTLQKGKIYEAYSYRDKHYKVKVENREDDVLVPESLVMEVFGPKVQTGPYSIGGKKVPASLTELVNDALLKKAADELDEKLKNDLLRPESEHYHTGGVDVWQFADENFSQIEVEGFHRINTIKYLARYGKKNGYNRKDLEKAIVSIEKLIELHDKDDRK